MNSELQRLKDDWNERATSPLGRFFIASHAGYDDPERWREHAEADAALLLQGLPESWLERARVLEVGCGVGRLAQCIAARCQSYFGIDISARYLEEARTTFPPKASAQFHETDGVSIPSELASIPFDLIFAFAVFIHCPRNVIETFVPTLSRALSDGGILRFTLLSDPTDPGGLLMPLAKNSAPPKAPTEYAPEDLRDYEIRQILESAGLQELTDERSYKGAVYRFADAKETFERLLPGFRTTLIRLDPTFMAVDVRRHVARSD